MNRLELVFYGDDFTGSTDALEQLALAGMRAMLFLEPPTPRQLAPFKGLQAIGIAGKTRSLAPAAMARELRPALKQIKRLGARHIHYKVCSTFDSSPTVGSIGRVMDVAAQLFQTPFIPLLVAAPALGRFCVFGNLFARYALGTGGAIHRLDRHPSVSKHPITPMTEADLRLHLAKQTRQRIELFDVLEVSRPLQEASLALKQLLTKKPAVVLFDALYPEQLTLIGGLVDGYASAQRPLFSVGSSAIETALATHLAAQESRSRKAAAALCRPHGQARVASAAKGQLLVASGSCSPVTGDQIAWARAHGFGDVALDTAAIVAGRDLATVIQRAADAAARYLLAGRSVIVHTSIGTPDRRVAATVKALARRKLSRSASAQLLGGALGRICREAVAASGVRRVCLAGGDTASFAARALGIEAVEMVAPLTPGAPLCRAYAPSSPADSLEVVFKGGQVGGENYFDVVKKRNIEIML
jgi:3-oxoisoapionate kinase